MNGSPDDGVGEARHHVLIAGTGRAGTSALVRYFTELGLETHLSRPGGARSWDEAAQAGLEDVPLSAISPDLPYVVKSPWAYQLADEMFGDPKVIFDAVIVPIRDLGSAAASRTVRELQELHHRLPWMAKVAETWENWGQVSGGAIYSLDVVDVARLLAVGFYRLIERAAAADVPIVVLSFPRFITDADYLYEKIRTVLPSVVSVERARGAHGAVFRPEMVRIEHELAAAGAGHERRSDALEIAALKREVIRLRAERDGVAAERDTLRDVRRDDEIRASKREKDFEEEGMRRETAREADAAALRAENERMRASNDDLERQIGMLRESRSWRITRPLRTLARLLRRVA